jgi:hypothetical protein
MRGPWVGGLAAVGVWLALLFGGWWLEAEERRKTRDAETAETMRLNEMRVREGLAPVQPAGELGWLAVVLMIAIGAGGIWAIGMWLRPWQETFGQP